MGKSTLMNLLAGEEKSIVTEIPGTTRDVVRDTVRLGDVVLDLSDTAGIRDTQDRVEALGVARSLELLDRCDLILAVFDSSRPLDAGDLELLDKLDGRLAVGIINKTDLPGGGSHRETVARHTRRVVELSARDGTGVAELAQAVAELTGLARLDPAAGLVANRRQLDCVLEASRSLEEAESALEAGQTLDAVSVSMEEALDSILELTGRRASPEIIDRVFQDFCVGK